LQYSSQRVELPVQPLLFGLQQLSSFLGPSLHLQLPLMQACCDVQLCCIVPPSGLGCGLLPPHPPAASKSTTNALNSVETADLGVEAYRFMGILWALEEPSR
jgi:hypothetical protein